jgi:TRAP-type C4-dicarboxylate transport system permease small subunit
MGASIAYKQKAHIAITVLPDRLSVRAKMFLSTVVEIITLVFFCLVFKLGIDISLKVSPTPMPASEMSMAVMYSALPVSMGILIIHSIASIASLFSGRTAKERS